MSELEGKVIWVMDKLLSNICVAPGCTWHCNRHRKILAF